METSRSTESQRQVERAKPHKAGGSRLSDRLWSWASILDSQAEEQALQTSRMPFIYPHVALMPDAHLGLGATVGSVIPTLGAVIPAAVGVDIGCGMVAVRTQYHQSDIAHLSKAALRLRIENVIPVSAGCYNSTVTETAESRISELILKADKDSIEPWVGANNWEFQLGSLGSGNHFIEVSLDESDRVWFFLHSGSRGVGNKIAQRHIAIARNLMTKYWIDLPNKDLAYLAEGTNEFWQYIRELRWAQLFALLNREEMMDRVVACFDEWSGLNPVIEEERINCHHNFTEKEWHAGREVWISRKGAIRARKGESGLIPGSMGTASYIVEGLGNALSLESAPHGAGREFSRSAARKKFTQEDLRSAMAGIEYRDTDAFIDEIPAAYKNIDIVMQDARDLVSIRHVLRQIINVKGD